MAMIDYVLFEGLDLSGKTTAARQFIDESNQPWDLREKTLSDSNPIASRAKQHKNDGNICDEAMGWWHYAAFRNDLDQLDRIGGPVVPTVQESLSVVRSIAFHAVLGDSDLADQFRKTLPRVKGVFTEAFMLTAAIEVREERLAKRIVDHPGSVSFLDMLVREEPAKFLEMERHAVDAVFEIHPDATMIDSGELSISSITTLCLSRVLGQGDHYQASLFSEPYGVSEPVSEARVA